MIRSTFLHLTGIGPATEVALWRSGCLDWSSLREAAPPAGVRGERLRGEIELSEAALRERRIGWFGRRLPRIESWRLATAFRPETAFLDIETTSLSPYDGIVTVVCVHGGGATRSFVADDNLEELPAYLQRFPIVVSFNGLRFDMPYLRVRFPQLPEEAAHIDLRYLLYRIGIAGGLKRIEQTLGIGDRGGVEGVDGLEAVRLWEEHKRGRDGALDRLIRYNRADTVNLEPLLDFAVAELTARLLPRGLVAGSRPTRDAPTPALSAARPAG